MTEKLRKFAILLILPLHLFLTYGMTGNSGTFMMITVLLTMLADLALSFWQLQSFTAKYSRIRTFGSEYLRYLLQAVLVGAAEGLIYFFAVGSILNEDWDKGLLFTVSVAELILGALVAFVTGAARTMMYHDEKR
jgi:hypothetical protein